MREGLREEGVPPRTLPRGSLPPTLQLDSLILRREDPMTKDDPISLLYFAHA